MPLLMAKFDPKHPKSRARRRNEAREAKLAGKVAANFQPKKPRPKQEPVVHELPPKREPKTRGADGKFSKSPHAPTYCSKAGYKSRQERQAELNKGAKAGTTAKSRRADRQSASKARKAMEAKKSRAKANRKG